MPHDALDPGPNGDYPWFPRDANGVPLWTESDSVKQVDGVTPMARGLRTIRRNGRLMQIDVTPRGPGGEPIDPPTIPR